MSYDYHVKYAKRALNVNLELLEGLLLVYVLSLENFRSQSRLKYIFLKTSFRSPTGILNRIGPVLRTQPTNETSCTISYFQKGKSLHLPA